MDAVLIIARILFSVFPGQIIGLACGKPIRGHVAFFGGPLYFFSELKAVFVRTLELKNCLISRGNRELREILSSLDGV